MRPQLAVILAAGRGVRLGAAGQEAPKGFLELGGRTLIERSLDALRAAGIQRVRIVTGHLAERYEALAARLGPWVSTVHNEQFASSGSLVSLLCAGAIDEPYLLVESDLIYEPRAPRLLVEAPAEDVLLASGATASGDEVYVGAADGTLVDLTKRRETLRGELAGELVGLTRVSPALHQQILQQGRELLAATPHVEYEAALVAAGRHHAITILPVADLVWTEIDDEAHLARARALILPRLGHREDMELL